VQRGDVVRFVQEGTMPHNVQFVRNTAPRRLGDRRLLDGAVPERKKGETYEVRVDERFQDGTYEYVCTPHIAMGMKGTITVSGGLPAADPVADTRGPAGDHAGVQGLQPLAYEMDGTPRSSG
jgi:hypothetical protein